MIVATEIAHSMSNRKGKRGWFAFKKVNLEKAYGKLEWDFIRVCLKSFYFDSSSIDLIMSCFSSVSTSIVINGSPSDPFLPSRGIHQGDPLSPYLFIHYMELLSRLIHSECESGS